MKSKNPLFLSLAITFGTLFIIAPSIILISSFLMDPATYLLLIEKGRTLITLCSAALCAFFVGYYYFKKHADVLPKKLGTLIPLFFIVEALIVAQLYRLALGDYSYESFQEFFHINLFGLLILFPRLIATFFVIKKSLYEGIHAAQTHNK